MGYNTSILILNDARSVIKSNPLQFTENVLNMMDITNGIKPGDSMGLGNHCNPMSLITRSDADISHLVLIGQNSSEALYQTGIWHGDIQKNLDIIKKATAELKYRNKT